MEIIMTDPLSGAALYWALAGASTAGAVGGAALSGAFDDKAEGADGPSGPKAPPPLPVAPTQAKAPGSDKTQAEYDVNRARDAERRRAGLRQGQSNTILTGSLGVSGSASTNRKTLLGA